MGGYPCITQLVAVSRDKRLKQQTLPQLDFGKRFVCKMLCCRVLGRIWLWMLTHQIGW